MRKILFLFTALFPLLFIGQNEFKKWYFGRYTGLDFMTSPPTVITHSTMTTFEGSASIADAQGNLLFYTDGNTIWNKSHLVMANGTGLFGSGTSVQSAIIVQKPGSACHYYVFTLDGQGWTNGLMYSVVDVCANGGLGTVLTKNVPLHTPCTEHLAAVRHCNGTDVWVVTHDFNSNTFLSYSVSAAGVNTTAVASVVGPTVSVFGQGTLKFSPSGKKMGFTGFNWIPKIVTLFDFDVATGLVSNPLTVLSTTNVNCYGCEFSPDNTRFYTAGGSAVYQWNLCAGSPTAVAASQTTVGSTTVSGQLQLAPDGKIYIVRWGAQTLDAILNPNGLGTACNYSSQVQSVATGSNGSGLPNFLAGVYKQLPSFSHTVNTAISCATATFATPPLTFTTVGCASTTYSFAAFSWDFGHPASGTANTSTLSNPVHNYGSPGTYHPKLVLHYACGTDTVRGTVVIPGPTISIQSSGINCSTPGSATVNVSGGSGQYSYTWTPGAMSGSVATVTPGTYSLQVKDLSGSCTYTISHLFTPPVPLTATMVQTSSVACYGQTTGAASVAVTPGTSGPSGVTYSWSNGQTTSVASGLGAGLHSVTIYNGLCSLTKTIQLSQPDTMTVAILVPAIPLCAGKTVTLVAMASGGTPSVSFAWSSGQSGAQLNQLLIASGIYTNQVTAKDKNGCTATSTISLTILGNPLPVSQSATICANSAHTFTVSGGNSYHWMPGNTSSQTLAVTPSASVVYTVTAFHGNGCSNSVTVSAFVIPCIGLDEFSVAEAVSVFPNPASELVFLALSEKTELIITSVEGIQVFTKTLEKGLHQVSVKDWAKGVYLITSKTRTGESRQRFVVGE